MAVRKFWMQHNLVKSSNVVARFFVALARKLSAKYIIKCDDDTFEWPEEDYPPYANGPGYILSSDIANSIVNEFEGHKLRLFKMEDVSM
ncbi:hypothetical protein Ddye_002480 [Dipteronia dyeriana]|uniref:Hexosyltransferase n=1 Tax=Dipteronia dyeriana TaxID=168575 RepID=A0AAD9XR08_9ROSI|nr:hypothetical protein Ddye_002480 [Dipteronia dyeriana]